MTEESIISEAVKSFASSKNSILQDLSNRITQILKQKFSFNNYKINSIETRANPQVDNPYHNLNFESKNSIIHGNMGTGKTTFFDKIIHPFNDWEREKSFIHDIVTNIEIKFDNAIDQIELNFNSSAKTGRISLDKKNEEESVRLLKSYGFFERFLVLISFIGESADYPDLFKDGIENILKFREYFYSPINLNVLRIFRNTISEVRKDITVQQNQLVSSKNVLIDIKTDIKKIKDDISDIKDFLENFNEIKTKLTFLKSNADLLSMNAKKRMLKRDILEIKQKIMKRQNYFDAKTKKSMGNENNFLDFIIDLHMEAANVCPVCSNALSLESFTKSYKNQSCYLCKSGKFEYRRFKKLTETTDKPNIFQYSLLLNEKKEQMKTLNQKIAAFKTKFLKSDDKKNSDIIKLMSKFYWDINRPNFSLDEEYGRKQRQLKNFRELLNSKLDQKEEYISLNSELEERLKQAREILKTIRKEHKKFKKYIDEINSEYFENFKKDLSYFWDKLSSDEIKSIIIRKNEIEALTFSKQKAPRSRKIISFLKKTQKGLSKSQLNVIRYAIHLSIIKNLAKKYENLPIKVIIIDDPEIKILDTLIKVLEDDFTKTLDFQFIILTSKKISNFNGKIYEFERFNDIIKKSDPDYQLLLDQYIYPNVDDSESES